MLVFKHTSDNVEIKDHYRLKKEIDIGQSALELISIIMLSSSDTFIIIIWKDISINIHK